MNKKNIKNLRVMLVINFVAEIIGIITLYLSDIHSIKILSINVLSCLFVIMNFVGLLLLLKLVKGKEKLIVLSSIILEILIVILSFFMKTLIPYLQVISDLLKLLVIISIYKKLKKSKKIKNKKIIFIMIISYIIAKIYYILLNLVNGLTLRPILTTISIIGIVIVYTLYIKELEKK